MQARFKLKESLEWIVYNANGEAIAAFRDSADATANKPEHGYVLHHDDPPPTPQATEPKSSGKGKSGKGKNNDNR